MPGHREPRRWATPWLVASHLLLEDVPTETCRFGRPFRNALRRRRWLAPTRRLR